jgi:hypothetical protein
MKLMAIDGIPERFSKQRNGVPKFVSDELKPMQLWHLKLTFMLLDEGI